MANSKAKPPKVDPSKKRKPPRLTNAVFRYANQYGYNLRIVNRPDGSVETQLTKPIGSSDAIPEV